MTVVSSLLKNQLKLWVIFKEIEIIQRLFLVIAMYCQASSRQMKSITEPPALLKYQLRKNATLSS